MKNSAKKIAAYLLGLVVLGIAIAMWIWMPASKANQGETKAAQIKETSMAPPPLNPGYFSSEKDVRKDLQKITRTAGDLSDSRTKLSESFFALSRLTGDLTAKEITALCAFLEEVTQFDSYSLTYIASLKNDIINRLAQEKNCDAQVQSSLLKIQADPRQPIVMRDYAVQHLGLNYSTRYPNKEESRKAFWALTAEHKETLAATALLALHRIDISGELPQEEHIRLLNAALSLAKTETAIDTSRMAGLAILRNNKSTETLEAAKQILLKKNTIPLTTVALAAVGVFANAADETWIRECSHLQAKQLAPRFAVALEKIKSNTSER